MQRQTATNCGVRCGWPARRGRTWAMPSCQSLGRGRPDSRGKTLAFSFYPPPAASYRTWTAHSEEVQRKLVDISVTFIAPSPSKMKGQDLRYQIMLKNVQVLLFALGRYQGPKLKKDY